jgi:hypothetical protein
MGKYVTGTERERECKRTIEGETSKMRRIIVKAQDSDK